MSGFPVDVTYQRKPISAEDFRGILNSSGLGARRPVDDLPRLQAMIDHADLIVTARTGESGRIVRVARSLTDWSYACYLSDLAVAAAYQGQGIGKRLIEETRRHIGPKAMCLLVSAPGSVGFYDKIGMPRIDGAFLYPRAE